MHFGAGRCAQHLSEAAVGTKVVLSVSCCLLEDIGGGLGGSTGSGLRDLRLVRQVSSCLRGMEKLWV